MIRPASLFFWFGIILASSLALYQTREQVHETTRTLKTINQSIAEEKESIHVLGAEWVYLSNPARVEKVAQKYLTLQPTPLGQIVKMENLPQALALAEQAQPTTRIATPEPRQLVIPRIAQTKPAIKTASPYPRPKVKSKNATRMAEFPKPKPLQHAASMIPNQDPIGAMIGAMQDHP